MGVIKTEVEMRKNASILAFMEMRRDSEGYNTSERAGTHLNNPETRARPKMFGRIARLASQNIDATGILTQLATDGYSEV